MSSYDPNHIHTKVKVTRKAVAFVISKGFFNFIVFLLAIVILGTAVITLTSQPSFCNLCHIVRPAINSWKESSHSKVKCLACHVEPGFFNLIKEKAGAVKEPILYFTGNYETPLNKDSELAKEMSDESCLECHKTKETEGKVTYAMGIIMNHSAHAEAGLSCIKCHNRIAHPSKDHKNFLSMDFCFTCHTGNALKNDCKLCHTEIFLKKSRKK